MARIHTAFLTVALLACLGCVSTSEQLYRALEAGDTAKARSLIRPSVAVNTRYLHGNTPLHIAALHGRDAEIELLLQNGADVNARNQEGDTPLHDAALNLHIAAAELLIARGADVNAADNGGRTPIFEVARSGGLHLVTILVGRGAIIAKTGLTPLNAAAGGTPHRGSRSHEELVRYFLDKGVDPNAQGSCGFCLGDCGCTALHAAAFQAGKGVLSLLIERGAVVDARDPGGLTPLFHAALGGNAEAAAFLIAKGADVHARDKSGRTALHVAVRLNNLAGWGSNSEVVKLLLANGAEVNARDGRECTPLHDAVFHIGAGFGKRWDNPDTVRALLEGGADVAAKDRQGRTPLSLVATSLQQSSQPPTAEDKEILRLLQEHANRLPK